MLVNYNRVVEKLAIRIYTKKHIPGNTMGMTLLQRVL